MKVVVVDDSQIVRKNLKKMLMNVSGICKIDEAGNAADGIEIINQINPEVIILDVRMPGGNGFEVLKQFKSKKQRPLLIMISNYSYSGYREKSLKEGADFFFDKSTEFEKVIQVIREHILKKAS